MIKEFEYGKIEYKLPNIPQAMELLGELGINADGTYQIGQFALMAKMIRQLDKFISVVDCDFDGIKVTTFDGLIEQFESMAVLSEISGEILNKLNMSAKKKP